MGLYEENKLINDKITKTKSMLGELGKQIDKAHKERDVLDCLKAKLAEEAKKPAESAPAEKKVDPPK